MNYPSRQSKKSPTIKIQPVKKALTMHYPYATSKHQTAIKDQCIILTKTKFPQVSTLYKLNVYLFQAIQFKTIHII